MKDWKKEYTDYCYGDRIISCIHHKPSKDRRGFRFRHEGIMIILDNVTAFADLDTMVMNYNINYENQ